MCETTHTAHHKGGISRSNGVRTVWSLRADSTAGRRPSPPPRKEAGRVWPPRPSWAFPYKSWQNHFAVERGRIGHHQGRSVFPCRFIGKRKRDSHHCKTLKVHDRLSRRPDPHTRKGYLRAHADNRYRVVASAHGGRAICAQFPGDQVSSRDVHCGINVLWDAGLALCCVFATTRMARSS